ncbi:type IV secretion protein Rhs, partial [Pseudomonas sp. WS 5106]|nr:type IV secretion protein Rhs [Pseudomonas cremoris]MBC2410395.1 type IV secretion protein Rhs [Pseudomonas cremoris]
MNPAIGRLALTPMNVKTVDVEAVFRDFRECLNTFDAWAESFWSFSALEVEQVFKVGDEVALIAPINRSLTPNTTTAMCGASGTLTLVHLFQSTRFVPIGDTPVVLQRVDPNGGPLGEPLHKTIGPSGILEINECDRNQQYRVSFYPNVSKDHVKALYASYQVVIQDLEVRLRQAWTDTFQAQWKTVTNANPIDQRRMLETAFLRGMGTALYSLWDNFKQLYALLADIKPNSEKLLQYVSQAELDELLKLGSESIAKGLLVLSDEPLMFIYLSAISSWIRMLPPQDMNEVMGEITGEVLISLLLLRVFGAMGVAVRLGAQVLSHIKSSRARQLLTLLSEQLVSPHLASHADAVKPLLLSGPARSIKTIPAVPLKAGDQLVSNPVAMARDKAAQRTALVRQEHVDDVPVSGKNPNGDAASSADKTATNGCPVSMVTGEELLTLTDGALDGILPFEWTRLYRTSAVEV